MSKEVDDVNELEEASNTETVPENDLNNSTVDPDEEGDPFSEDALKEPVEGAGEDDFDEPLVTDSAMPVVPRGTHQITIVNALHATPILRDSAEKYEKAKETYLYQRRTVLKLVAYYVDPATRDERTRAFDHNFFTFAKNSIPLEKASRQSWMEWAEGEERMVLQLLEATGLEKSMRSLFVNGKDLDILTDLSFKAAITHEKDSLSGNPRERIKQIFKV